MFFRSPSAIDFVTGPSRVDASRKIETEEAKTTTSAAVKVVGRPFSRLEWKCMPFSRAEA